MRSINLIRGFDRLALIVGVLAIVYGFLFPSSGLVRCVDFVCSYYITHDAIEVYSLDSDLREASKIYDSLTAAGVSGIAGPGFILCDGPGGVIARGRARLEHCLEVCPRTKLQLERALISGGDPDGIFVNGRTYCAGLGPGHLYLLPQGSQRLDNRFLKALIGGFVIALAIGGLSRAFTLAFICSRWILLHVVDLTIWCLNWIYKGFVDQEVSIGSSISNVKRTTSE